jgi:GTPase SAR1 family protein
MNEGADAKPTVPQMSDHLHPQIRTLLGRPKEERIAAIEKDVYVPYPKAYEALDIMERLCLVGGSAGMLMCGASGCGKSTLFKVFLKRHPPTSSPDSERIPVLRIETPEVPGGRRFLGAILEAFGFDNYVKDSLESRRIRVLKELKGTGVRLILVDEIHNLLGGSSKQLEETANLLKNLSNTFEIPIVLAGTDRARNVFRYDDQLLKRFPIFELPAWGDGKEYRDFLRRLESTFPLPRPSELYDDAKANYLLEQSKGVTGDIIRASKEAAIRSIRDDAEKITLEYLKKSRFRSQYTI